MSTSYHSLRVAARITGGIIGLLYAMSTFHPALHAFSYLFHGSFFSRLLFLLVILACVAGILSVAFAWKRQYHESTPAPDGLDLPTLENALLPSRAANSNFVRSFNAFAGELWMVLWPVLVSLVVFWIVYPFSGRRFPEIW